jgi:hypothetical protein
MFSRWGHDPAHPQLELSRPLYRRGRPPHKTLAKASKQAAVLYTNAARFPDLRRIWWSRSKQFGGAERRMAPCHSRRSERREIHTRVARALIYRTDLRTGRVGTPLPGDRCLGISIATLASWIGASYRRTERAVLDFLHAGLLISSQPREPKPDGGYRGLPGIRCFTRRFWDGLGMGVEMELVRRKVYRQWRESRRLPRDPVPDAEFTENENRRFVAALADVSRAHQAGDPALKGLSHGDLVAIARARAKPPPSDT